MAVVGFVVVRIHVSNSITIAHTVTIPKLLLLLVVTATLDLLVKTGSLPTSMILRTLSNAYRDTSYAVILSTQLPHALTNLLTNNTLNLTKTLVRALAQGPLTSPNLLNIGTKTDFTVILNTTLFNCSSTRRRLTVTFTKTLITSLVITFANDRNNKRLDPIHLALTNITLTTILRKLADNVTLLGPSICSRLHF